MGGFKGKLVIDQYQQHYFSGSQCRIYMDGIYVADINYIDYSIASNKAPIYSYNDPYYKVVARGNYIAQGSFNINLSDREKLVKIDTGMKMKRPSTGDDINIDSLRSSDSLLKYFDNSSAIDIGKIIKKYENAYWGKNNKSKRYNRPDEWDLLSNGDLDPEGFDIVMIFGYPHGSTNQFTIKQINDVHITGESMVTADNGQPIQLQYQYFARCIDGEPTIFQDEKVDAEVEKKKEMTAVPKVETRPTITPSTTPIPTTSATPRKYDYLYNYPVKCNIYSEWEDSGKTNWMVCIRWAVNDPKITIKYYEFWNSYDQESNRYTGGWTIGYTIHSIPSAIPRVALRNWKFVLQHSDDPNNGTYQTNLVDRGTGTTNRCIVDKPAN